MSQRSGRGTFAVCFLMALSVAFLSVRIRASSRSISVPPAAPRPGSSWDPKAAAAYLDQRVNWWMGWPRAARDHETFCISCHTAVPYALTRSVLRKPLSESGPSVNERRILENVTKRVRLWKEVAPFYSDADRGVYKTVESRGTESVLNALMLASNESGSAQLSQDGKAAFQYMWAEQIPTGADAGSWRWLRFANEPWEADDSAFYGAALAAIAVGTAPGNYREQLEIRNHLKILREYLNREAPSQTLVNRTVLLWASVKLPGLLNPEKKKAIVAELLAAQQLDGGWSLPTLSGDWKRHDDTPQETRSEGYSTGLVVFTLHKAGIDSSNPQVQKGLNWLAANQDTATGRWPGYSLNKNVEHHISPETALFMNDAATAYAVLALTDAAQP